VRELQLSMERIRQALAEAGATAHSLGARVSHAAAVKASIEDALALILEEHQDWQMLVRPHHLPLA
jgi:hypothetical protein